MTALSTRQKLALLAILSCCTAWPSRAALSADGQTREYEIKAAFIYQLSQFADWPTRRGERTFNVCVLGADPFGGNLKSLESRTHFNQPLVAAYLQSATLARDCGIVYLADDQRGNVPAILSQLRGYPVLTVSSLPGFVDQGGGVGFVVENARVRLEINNQAARHAQIKLSAKLLEVAKRVVDAPTGSVP
jgi:hypothetical protein